MSRISAGADGAHKGTRPKFFMFDRKPINTVSWVDLLIKFMEAVDEAKGSALAAVAPEITGRKRPYFSKDASELTRPHPLKKSGFFVETNLAANNCKSLCDEVHRALGYGESLTVSVAAPEGGPPRRAAFARGPVTTPNEAKETKKAPPREKRSHGGSRVKSKAGPIIDTQTNALNVEVETVLRRYARGTYFVPAYQRDADEWDDEKKSLFIESILNRLTVPAFYIAESEADPAQYEIVDGQQRIDVMHRFHEGRFRLLSGTRCPYFSEFSDHYAERTFADLSSQWAAAFNTFLLNVVVLPREMPLDLRLEIFRRINDGGTPLSGQDIRLSYYSESPAVRFIQLAGIYDPTRTGSRRMIENAKDLSPWPWAGLGDDATKWTSWWENTKTVVGQTPSEMFLWYLVSRCRQGVDELLEDREHVTDGLRLAFRDRGEEVLDIVCAELRHQEQTDDPRLLPNAVEIARDHFPPFAAWFIAMFDNCAGGAIVSRHRSVALLIPGLIDEFGSKPTGVRRHHWNWIGRFVSKTRETAENLSVDFPESKGRWRGERGAREQLDAFDAVAKAIRARAS